MPRLIAFGDAHLFRLWMPPWALLGKRLIGQGNLWLNRRHRFDPGALDLLVRRAARTEADVVLITGDLTTTAQRGEFEDARTALRPLTRKDRTTLIVAGNHDRYTFSASYRRLFEQYFSAHTPERFPHHHQISDRWSLLALDTAVPRLLSSRGRLGHDQIQAARASLAAIGPERGAVVFCHYPVLTPLGVRPKWQHRLADAPAFCAMLEDLQESGQLPCRLVFIHGHIHEPWAHQVPAGKPLAGVIDLNPGSCCMTSPSHRLGQGMVDLTLPDDPADRIFVEQHRPVGHDPGAWISARFEFKTWGHAASAVGAR